MVSEADLAQGLVYPPLSKIREVSVRLAVALAHFLYAHNMATVYPEPSDKEAFVRAHLYCTAYESFLPSTWAYPANL